MPKSGWSDKFNAMMANYATDMDYRSLKLLMSAGDLAHCELVPVPLSKGWIIQIQRKSGQLVTMQTRRGQDKVYGSLTTAAQWARDIGFKRFSVYMPENLREMKIQKSEDF
ncbi:hypothetical protein HNQ57_003575 [Zhongshania antarctica]|uniref:Uncharacterized protein n=1 Tax=Zhongshania antarctica TaxID=641702 RepID=A0A840RA96_9GAMM|nr:hypothetical protein [Zhongshania antarctica]MBB5189272.1 hypothetical protein [Zhongshania antarctica]